ncbi:MAG: VWA domain-containing protein, partial [Pseudomonadota bacterium]
MRKLPVFFVIDVSESMAGPAHEAVSAGIADIVSTLRTDPQALEMAQLSIIVFAGRAKVLVPMMELLHFYPPDLPIGGGTGLGAALDLLMTEIDKNVVTKSSDGRKGDWKPIVFLMTDGHPTDDPEKSIKRWEEHYARRVNLVAVSVGGSANHKMLQRLTENVVVLTDASATTFKRFLVWISQSIAAESRAAGDGHAGGPVNLSKTLPRGASVLDDLMPEVNIDDRLAGFIGRC